MRKLSIWGRALVFALVAYVAATFLCDVAPALAQTRPQSVAPPVLPAPGHFAGKWELAPLFDHKACPKGSPPAQRCSVQKNGHQLSSLRNTISFRMLDGTLLTAPAGMPTDLASIPAVLWPWLPPDGSYGMGATIHDDCYATKGSFVWVWHATTVHPVKTFVGLVGPPLTRPRCDEAFRQTMVTLGVPTWKRVLIWSAVRTFGRGGFGS